MTTILHVSDIHAGAPQFDSYIYQLDQKLNKQLQNNKVDFLVCSGDLTFKGEKEAYKKVVTFFQKTTKDLVKTILVPGNHDICAGESLFTSFDIAANKINDTINCRFSSQSCSLFSSDEIDFFLANSAYTGDPTYGEIDIDELSRLVTLGATERKKILITHHPFLAEPDDKCSSVRNSRKVLQYLAENAFTAVLHGHQHMNTRFGFKFEESIVDVIGIRSLSLSSPGIPIGAQLVYIDESAIRVAQIDLSKDRETSW